MSIGIIINPASGKDIRRLVSHATVMDNNEKMNIVKRAILGAAAMGVEEFLLMPDSFQLARMICNQMKTEDMLSAKINLLDMPLTSTALDTVEAAARMEQAGCGCILLLGGDGTSRAAAKSLQSTPLLPISTGTNNVYPYMVEGTTAGICAAVISRLPDPAPCCIRDKRLGIIVDGTPRDIALVDAVISTHSFAGARAIWDMDEILAIMVARSHPQSIGFSAIIGCMETVTEEDDWGLFAHLGSGRRILAPVAPGIVERVRVTAPERIPLDGEYQYVAKKECMIALDGEREVKIRKGETVAFRITRDGPLRVCIKETMECAQRESFFERP